ncbi:glycosyltransferase [bacterium]|nr:glycosyltransferase [bacterium]
MPKVSIILPVYNVESYLRQCLDSIIMQTLEDIEIICVNDGSTDNSLEILQEYKNKDSRIKIINQENRGQGVARNIALENITGDYIGFVDPDDYISPNMYKTLYETAIKHNCDIVEESFYIKNEIRNYLKKRKNKLNLPKNKIFNYKVKKNYVFSPNLAIWNKLYKTSFIKENDIKFFETKKGEDIIFTIKSRVLASKIVYIDNADYYYRIKKDNVPKSYKNTSPIDELNRQIKFLDKIKNALIEDKIYELIKYDFENYSIQKLKEKYKILQIKDQKIFEQALKNVISENLFKRFKKEIFLKNIIDTIFCIFNTIRNNQKVKVIRILGIEINLPNS